MEIPYVLNIGCANKLLCLKVVFSCRPCMVTNTHRAGVEVGEFVEWVVSVVELYFVAATLGIGIDVAVDRETMDSLHWLLARGAGFALGSVGWRVRLETWCITYNVHNCGVHRRLVEYLHAPNLLLTYAVVGPIFLLVLVSVSAATEVVDSAVRLHVTGFGAAGVFARLSIEF